MPRRKEEFLNGELYHICVRALDDNLIFKDVNDYYRGIFSIYELNNSNFVTIQTRRKARRAFKNKLRKTYGIPNTIHLSTEADNRDKLVEILTFCFMPNHIHLLIKQLKDGGISKFMQKFGGYGRYFNDKYHRKGHVFMDSFRSVHIENDNQLMVVIAYIFTNPVSLIEPGWKELGIRNHSIDEIMKFLKEYKWSSYQDCIGIKNFPSVTERDFLSEFMGSKHGTERLVKNWLKQKERRGKFADLFLE